FRGNQYAFGIHAIEDVTKTLAFFTDQAIRRNFHLVKKHLVGVVIDHGVNGADFHALAYHLTQIHQKYRQAIAASLHLTHWHGSGQQHHQVRLEWTTGPDFLAIDNITITFFLCTGQQLRSITTGAWLGYPKSLQT